MSFIIERALEEINAKYGEAPTEIIFDDKIQRFGKNDHGWYVGHEWDYKGQLYQTITYGSWRAGDEVTIKSWDHKTESQKGFRQSYVKKTQEAKIRRDQEVADKNKACKLKWGQIFKKAKTDAPVHPYLTFKGIASNFVARIDFNGVLLIPAYDCDGFVGVQRIYEDPETKRFVKKFSSGIKLKGAFCPLTPFKSAKYVILTEGFATGASIQMAFPDVPVVCVFNAGNISPAVAMVRAVNPDCKIVIAADKDPLDPKMKIKPGEHFAKKACNAHPNVIYKLPIFPVDNPAWTDFNDLQQFGGGLEVVKTQLQIHETDFLTITTLGYLENDYFYTSTSNNQIIKLSASAHQKLNFLSLAPSEYWVKNFGVETESGATAVSWETVASDLMKKCRETGLYNPEKVRGRGVWKEGNTFVINDGEKVFPVVQAPEYHYQKLIKSGYKLDESFNDDEMEQLLGAIASLKYKNPQDYIYLAAWLVQGCIFSAVPWRFHVWLTGGRGNGKSTVMKWIHSLLPAAILTNDASAAGIRQDLKNDAFPTLYDESEPNAGRIRGVIDLARQMSSNGEFRALRGLTNGKGIAFNTQTVLLFGSIQVEHLEPADLSRIFVVDLLPTTDQDPEEYRAIKERITYFQQNKARFFSRCYRLIPTIITSTEIAHKYLVEKLKMESRLADQMATLIACFWVYASDQVITTEEVIRIVEDFKLAQSDYIEENKMTDGEACLHELMNMEVDRELRTVGFCIAKIRELSGIQCEELVRILAVYGLRYYPNENWLFVAKNSSKLREKLKKFPDYCKVLGRDKEICLINQDRQNIKNFGNVRGIRIKVPDSITTTKGE